MASVYDIKQNEHLKFKTKITVRAADTLFI